MQPSSKIIHSSKQISHTIQKERAVLIQQLKKEKQSLYRTQRKLQQQRQEYNKVMESNARNMKRIWRNRAKMEQMYKHRNKPQYFIQMSGFMNQYMQQFIFSHNYQFHGVQTDNPDQMSYQQLLALGDKIGKVSKGIPKEQFLRLKRVIVGPNFKQHCCCICQYEYQKGGQVIQLQCKHSYHEDCIFEWFKDEHCCPICKQEAIIEKYE